MTSIVEYAQQLAEALRSSDQYVDFLAAKEKIMADSTNYKMLMDFQAKQMELRQAQLLQEGEELENTPYIEELERFYSILSLNPSARAYLEREFELSCLFNHVNTIIGEAMRDALPIGLEE